MTNGLWKESLLVLIIPYWEKRFSREHTKNPNANVRARQGVAFWAVGYHPPPPESQLAFHIYYENMRTHLRAKGLVGMGGAMMFLKYCSIPYMYNTKVTILAPK